jgi:hypothetical protein
LLSLPLFLAARKVAEKNRRAGSVLLKIVLIVTGDPQPLRLNGITSLNYVRDRSSSLQFYYEYFTGAVNNMEE